MTSINKTIIPVSDTASRRRLRSASSGDLVVPATSRLTMGDRAFAVAGPRAWNKLPDSVRQSSSLDVFKRLLKTHLFSLSFYRAMHFSAFARSCDRMSSV